MTDAPNNLRFDRFRRLRWLRNTFFVLLVLHFVVLTVRPDMLGYQRPDRPGLLETASALINYGNRPPRVFEEEGRTWLWGGWDDDAHFDISTSRLNPPQLAHGLGRENFPALIEPEFESFDEADQWLYPEDEVLAIEKGDLVRVYPLDDMVRHEVVNDVIHGEPVFVAFCTLANLGAVYDREMNGHTLTFAVSGYTYADAEVWDGMAMFILWDRDTESLWWPGIGRAVSGPLIDQPLRLWSPEHWSQTEYGEVRERHEEGQVLTHGQQFDRPEHWPQLEPEEIQQVRQEGESADPAIAPRLCEEP